MSSIAFSLVIQHTALKPAMIGLAVALSHTVVTTVNRTARHMSPSAEGEQA
jgi:hypothetical protein